ncbi:MAG: hypothetical protein KAR06_05580 [Deltaproteobacteria bacterium]|nr:hypothetical protein [Deltaproteobacteria bacterium]
MLRKRNHHADLKTSWRLQKVKSILDYGGWYSAIDIEDEFKAIGRRIAAVGSAMSELSLTI